MTYENLSKDFYFLSVFFFFGNEKKTLNFFFHKYILQEVFDMSTTDDSSQFSQNLKSVLGTFNSYTTP